MQSVTITKIKHRRFLDGGPFAAAVVHNNITKAVTLPNKASIFRAELYAISLAVTLIHRSKVKSFIVFSDSMSSLKALNGFKLKLRLVYGIKKDYTHHTNSGKIIVMCWIPNYVNIRGNERADSATNQ